MSEEFCAYCFGPLPDRNVVDRNGIFYCTEAHRSAAKKPIKDSLPDGGMATIGGRGGDIALEYTRNHQRAD